MINSMGGGRKALSPMEDTILNMCADGDGTKQIAVRLGISAGTVRTHRERILRKLNANHICHAVAIYAKEGLLQ